MSVAKSPEIEPTVPIFSCSILFAYIQVPFPCITVLNNTRLLVMIGLTKFACRKVRRCNWNYTIFAINKRTLARTWRENRIRRRWLRPS